MSTASATSSNSALLGNLLTGATGVYGAQAGSADLASGLQTGVNGESNLQGTLSSLFGPETSLNSSSVTALKNALGMNGTSGNASATAAYQSQPGFSSSIQYGNQAINNQAAASGNLYSGATLAALGSYDTGVANQYYNQYVSNLLSSAGLGNTGTTSLASGLTSTQNTISQLQAGIGSANAAGAQGTASALTNLLAGAGVGSALAGAGSSLSSGLSSLFGGSNNNEGADEEYTPYDYGTTSVPSDSYTYDPDLD